MKCVILLSRKRVVRSALIYDSEKHKWQSNYSLCEANDVKFVKKCRRVRSGHCVCVKTFGFSFSSCGNLYRLGAFVASDAKVCAKKKKCMGIN